MVTVRSAIIASVLAAQTGFVLLILASIYQAGGVFEYALDDVYIHLAMAEQLYAGGYGVNAGEFASAASSPLYPVLLPTWAGMGAQAWLPLVWNIIALTIAAGLMGRALGEAELPKAGYLIVVIAPIALAAVLVAFTGMENLAHGAASLAIVVGLWRFVETGRVGMLLIGGIVLAPALRLEGLALALAAAGVVTAMGRVRSGIGLGLLAVLPVAIFAAILLALGLDPLPNSVNAKLSGAEGLGIFGKFRLNVATNGGLFVLALASAVLVRCVALLQDGRKGQALVGLAVVAAAIAHLAAASTGWMDRYENYLVLSLFAVLALLLAGMGKAAKTAILGVALAGGFVAYGPNLDDFVNNPRAIHLQQAQMARFAKEYLRAPVAVNDLGLVAWNNPNHVLDLWGLASPDALDARHFQPEPGWADPIAGEKGVEFAMIYDERLPEALGPDWVILGKLALLDPKGAFLGGVDVSFYTRNRAETQELFAELKDWAALLPDGAHFIFNPGAFGS